ncbi:MAG: MATE family efflux transporter [Candidatus Sumerlaeota bacterium]|nr:MATE family efflux transporter [Candidatus Sumerlaeota bacterium]
MDPHAREIRKQFVALVWPLIIQNILYMLMFHIDTAMVGRLNDVALAAMAIVGPINWTIMMVAMGLSIGTVVTVARSVGEKNPVRAATLAATSYMVGLGASVVATIFVLLTCHKITALFINDQRVISEANGYLKIIYVFFFFNYVSMIGGSILQASGDTKTPMVVTGFTNMLNVVGNYLLIYGKGGFPALGLFGAGLSTGICKTVEGTIMTIYLFSPRSKIRLHWSYFRKITKESVRELLKVSIPASTEPFFVNTGFLVFTKIVALLGTTAMAANRVANAIESISYMPGHAFSSACATMVGHKYGERSPKGIELTVRQSLKVSLSVMSGLGVLFLIIPSFLAKIFTNDHKLIALASVCIMIGAAEQPFLASVQILKGAFQGTGDTRRPIIIGAIGVWGPRLIFSYLLGIHFKLGLPGIWIATTTDWFTRACLYFWSYRRKKRHFYEYLKKPEMPITHEESYPMPQ